MIWARWFPPRAKDYAGILHPCNRFAGLGEVSDIELDRLDEEIRNISLINQKPLLSEVLPKPLKQHREKVRQAMEKFEKKYFGPPIDQVQTDGFGGATLGFGVGLVQDLPRNAILDTLEIVLDPLGSICEFFDSLDPDNPDNFVLKTAKAWQEGDSFSRGRIVGNVTGQVVIALTPVIAKKFAKIPTELGEARAVKVEPGDARSAIASTEKFVDTGIGKAGSSLGKMPAEDAVAYREWNYEKIRDISVKNPKSDSMTLGKYIPGEGGNPAPEAYTEMAKRTGDTYFDLGARWEEVKDAYTLTDTDMFDLFNTSALDKAVQEGKTIRFTHDPTVREYKGSALTKEWQYLKNKYGYIRVEPEGDYWYAIQPK